MKKGTKILLVVLAIIVICIIAIVKTFTGSYNQMVTLEQGVKSQWAQVENQYQRRYDLIPNLVETVKGYATHESEVFTNISEARSKAGGVVNVSDEVLNDPEAFARYQQVQSELGSALQRLLVVTENYPELKADENFLALQDQLEGTENRISTERMRYNEVVQEYNTYIKMFPRMIIANMSGFREKAFFTAAEGASTAPVVSF